MTKPQTTTVSREEVKSEARQYGKSTRLMDRFLYLCKKGEAIEFHHPDYVCLSKKALENRVKVALTSRDNEWREKIRDIRKADRYVEVFDNDSHRYQIPSSKVDGWKQFVEIPEDDERSWDVPVWAERIDGQPLTDHQSYNQALDDLLEQMEGEKL